MAAGEEDRTTKHLTKIRPQTSSLRAPVQAVKTVGKDDQEYVTVDGDDRMTETLVIYCGIVRLVQRCFKKSNWINEDVKTRRKNWTISPDFILLVGCQNQFYCQSTSNHPF